MTTVRADFISGQVQENPLSNVATTLTMSGRLQDLPTVGGGNVAYLTIDPEGVDVLAGSGTEVVEVTAYTHAAGTATVARGQRGTTGRPHSQGVKIVLSWMKEDVDEYVASSVLFDSTNPAAVDIAGSAAPGSGTVAAHRNHIHNVTGHDKAAHDALNIDADTLDGNDSTYFASVSNMNIGDSNTLSSANSHADSGDASTLSSANSHADTGDANTLSSAHSYADAGDASEAARAEGVESLLLKGFAHGGTIVGGSPGPPFLWQGGSDVFSTDSAGRIELDFPTAFPHGVILAIMENGDTDAFAGGFIGKTQVTSWTAAVGYFRAYNDDGSVHGTASVRGDWWAVGW